MTYTNHRLAICMIRKNDEKKNVIFKMKQTVVDYIVYSTSTTTHPTPPSIPPPTRKDKMCSVKAIFCGLFLCSVMNLDYQLLFGKGARTPLGGNQAYYERSLQ